MKVRYCGPGDFVNVHPYGRHDRDEIRDYPDEFAEELLATSKAQKFEIVTGGDIDKKDDNPLWDMTVAELKKMLDDMEIEYSGNAKKSELIELAKSQPANDDTRATNDEE